MSAIDLNKAREAAEKAEKAMEQRYPSPDATRVAQTWVGIGNLWANIDRAGKSR